MKFCYVDLETFGELDLTRVGVSNYVRHPSFEVMLAAWSLNSGETVEQYDRFCDGYSPPNALLDALEDDRVVKVAWNFAFEYNAVREAFGIDIPVRSARDPMVLARALSLPGKLVETCPVLNLPENLWKHQNGKALIRFWCGPRKPTKTRSALRNYPQDAPEKWEQFRLYNQQDVLAEIACYNRMLKWDLSEFEQRVWQIDHEINERGIPVNLPAVENACRLVEELTAARMNELREITGLDNANSQQQLLGWLQGGGYSFDDLKVGHVRRALKDAELDPFENQEYVRVLQLRADIAQTASKKYIAYREMTCSDGRLRRAIAFNGAGRTCRFSSYGVQVQNLRRPHPDFEKASAQERLARYIETSPTARFRKSFWDPIMALSSGVRGVIKAPPGKVFVSADFNAIENRILGWIANEERILQVFLDKRDPYIDFATYVYKQPYDELWAEYKAGFKKRRQDSKPAVLGCGYQLGAGKEYEDPATGEIMATGLLGYARGMDIPLTLDQAELSVEVWRETYSKCVDFWYDLSNAAFRAIETGKRTEVSCFEFEIDAPFLTMRLPSGRRIFYLRPRIEDRMKPWGKIGPTITYEGVDSRSGSEKWTRISTHPGKVTENGDQAIGRDLLVAKIVRAWDEGLDVCFHVHDEILLLADEADAERQVKLLAEIMSEPEDWAPGLPLAAVAEISSIFLKT